MITDPEILLQEFIDATHRQGLPGAGSQIRHEVLHSPHRQPGRLPMGYGATYAFSLSAAYGSTCPAGANRVLKMGKVGANSSPRFSSQHYLPNSNGSTLAKSLLNERILWTYLGIEDLDMSTVKAWMLEHLERDHFYVPLSDAGVERELERYLRGRLGPVFEG
jgi:hypothetical protein